MHLCSRKQLTHCKCVDKEQLGVSVQVRDICAGCTLHSILGNVLICQSGPIEAVMYRPVTVRRRIRLPCGRSVPLDKGIGTIAVLAFCLYTFAPCVASRPICRGWKAGVNDMTTCALVSACTLRLYAMYDLQS